MSRLHYIGRPEVHGIVEALTRNLFPGTPAFHLAGPQGEARLESALAQPHWPHHRTAQQKAAALHYSLNKNHPFVDGNKRLAVAAMEWFLFRNGFALFATNDHLVDFALRVADDRLSREDSAHWIERRALRAGWTDERVRRWHNSLSRDEAHPPRERIPRMVRLVSTAGRTMWLARTDLFPEPVPNYREDL